MKRFPHPRRWSISEIEEEAAFARDRYASRRPAETAAVLGGVFRPTNVLAAQERGVFIFWEHDLGPLSEFLLDVG